MTEIEKKFVDYEKQHEVEESVKELGELLVNLVDEE
jgi:hypothetical protein